MKIAVVEDNRAERAKIIDCLEIYSRKYSVKMEIVPFEDGSDFLDSFACQYDLVLLDIEMNKIGGIETARTIRATDKRVLIIFITNLVQYALVGYEVDALDFVVKPLTYAMLESRLNKVCNRLNILSKNLIHFKVKKDYIYLNSNDILFLETMNKKVLIHTGTEDIQTSETIGDAEKKLAGRLFFRCHSGFLIHLVDIDYVDQNNAHIGSYTIPVSRHRHKELLEKLAELAGTLL